MGNIVDTNSCAEDCGVRICCNQSLLGTDSFGVGSGLRFEVALQITVSISHSERGVEGITNFLAKDICTTQDSWKLMGFGLRPPGLGRRGILVFGGLIIQSRNHPPDHKGKNKKNTHHWRPGGLGDVEDRHWQRAKLPSMDPMVVEGPH